MFHVPPGATEHAVKHLPVARGSRNKKAQLDQSNSRLIQVILFLRPTMTLLMQIGLSSFN
jgi:hypothetical protein